MMDFNHSIRARLMTFISPMLVAAALIIGTVSLISTYIEISEVYDAQLVHSAKVLLQLTEHEADEEDPKRIEIGAERPELEHPYENNLTFRIWKDNELLSQSHQAEAFGTLRPPEGFSKQIIAEEDWRFFVFDDTRTNMRVEVGERYEVRVDLILKILSGLFILLLLFIPVPLIIVWYGVTRSLKPVIQLSHAVDTRDANDLKPIASDHIPQEILPLIRAINRLLARIKNSFERERQFTDNAAHELKTPLAAMKMQTQVLLKKTKDMPDCEAGLNNLHASIDRAAKMVDQLLSFARLQAENIEFSDIDLSALATEVLQDTSAGAIRKDIEIGAELGNGLTVKGNPNALALMLRNLIENAIKFTPEKGKIFVRAGRKNGQILIQISDTGAGIPDAEKDNVFERFYRANKSEATGSGLGLSMVKWVCDLHTAKIRLLDNKPHGLIVQITLPRP